MAGVYVLVLSVIVFVALILAIVRRRWRKLTILIAAVAAVWSVILSTEEADRVAQLTGWESSSEQLDAEQAGFSDPVAWRSHKSAQARAEAEAERLEAETIRVAAEAEDRAEREAGFHCLSAWDGSHRELVRQVKAQLREPDSFEHIETRVMPVNQDGRHSIFMRYRARNGFGGMNVATATGYYANKGCASVLLVTE